MALSLLLTILYYLSPDKGVVSDYRLNNSRSYLF